MNTTQVISGHSGNSGKMFIASPAAAGYMWNNLIIEKRISMNWLYKLYEGSILQDIVLVLISPVK